MSIAILSAISLVCADAAFAARPPVAPIISAAVQDAAETAAAPALIVEAAEPLEEADETAAASLEDVFAEPLVFDGESDDQVVERLKAYLESIDTLTGDFTQIAPSGAISTGKFYLRRPGFLRFEYDPPTPLLIVANGGMVYVRDEALETTDSYPVGKTPLKTLLSKKIDLEKDVAVTGVDRGVDSVAVTFSPEDDETEGELTVIAKAPEMVLTRWIVRDLQNGITVVTLENVKAGERLANRLFETPDAGGKFLKN